MIWRIFRKDCGQLWPLVAVVAMAQGANAALWFGLGHFREPRGLLIFAELLSWLVLLGMATLIAAVVQEDTLPGVSQDWLIRPIRRSDLPSKRTRSYKASTGIKIQANPNTIAAGKSRSR